MKLLFQLAKLGTERPFMGPESAYGISAGVAKMAIRDCTNRRQQKNIGSP
jgi:hypothetical protein